MFCMSQIIFQASRISGVKGTHLTLSDRNHTVTVCLTEPEIRNNNNPLKISTG